MTADRLIPALQSDALVREIERQFRDEAAAAAAAAAREAGAAIAQARAAARRRMHDAIQDLRREGARRLARARAQVETEERAQAQRRAARAVDEALPLLREALALRWRESRARRQWTTGVAQLCGARLRNSSWLVAHPPDWSEPERRQFVNALDARASISFKADDALTAGLRVEADQAVLDATPDGLLADPQGVAALLLEAIEVRR